MERPYACRPPLLPLLHPRQRARSTSPYPPAKKVFRALMKIATKGMSLVAGLLALANLPVMSQA
ncbi:uncharacterized protein METZ01_LOCUS256809, partial [marine metagenome]